MENKEVSVNNQPKVLGFRYDDNVLPFCTIYRINKTDAKETVLVDAKEVLHLQAEVSILNQEKADYMQEAERTCQALQEQLEQAQEGPQVVEQAAQLPEFARQVIEKLRRFEECTSDSQGADIGREWFDTLTHLGLLNRTQRSPGRWEITQEGEKVIKEDV